MIDKLKGNLEINEFIKEALNLNSLLMEQKELF